MIMMDEGILHAKDVMFIFGIPSVIKLRYIISRGKLVNDTAVTLRYDPFQERDSLDDGLNLPILGWSLPSYSG